MAGLGGTNETLKLDCIKRQGLSSASAGPINYFIKALGAPALKTRAASQLNTLKQRLHKLIMNSSST